MTNAVIGGAVRSSLVRRAYSSVPAMAITAVLPAMYPAAPIIDVLSLGTWVLTQTDPDWCGNGLCAAVAVSIPAGRADQLRWQMGLGGFWSMNDPSMGILRGSGGPSVPHMLVLPLLFLA